MLVVLFLGSQFSSGPCSVTVFTWPGRRLAWLVDWFRTWRSLETLCNKSSSFYNDFGRLYIVPFAFLLILYFGFTFKELKLLHFDVKIFDGWKDVFSCLCTFKLLVLNDGNKLFQLMTKWKGAQLHSPRSGHGPLIFLSGPYQGSRGGEVAAGPGEDSRCKRENQLSRPWALACLAWAVLLRLRVCFLVVIHPTPTSKRNRYFEIYSLWLFAFHWFFFF